MKKRGYRAIPKKTTKAAAVKREPEVDIRRGVSAKQEMAAEQKQGGFHEGQSVELVIGGRTDIGFRAVVDDSVEGLLYKNEVFQHLSKGQRIMGYIKKVREDGKLDLCLQKPGPEKVDDASGRILDRLKAHGGFIALDDNTRPEVVYSLLGVSKKTYKKAIGALYKKRLILIEDGGIRLAGKSDT